VRGLFPHGGGLRLDAGMPFLLNSLGHRRLERWIGMIEYIEITKCTGCGICDDVCPADVIHMEPAPVQPLTEGLIETRLLPVIKFREHCITCFSCEIFCPEQIVDVHPSVKNRPRPW
jgi:Pyruvate/2-oxoacid:ferredoxin oxidoreductase delta subunit